MTVVAEDQLAVAVHAYIVEAIADVLSYPLPDGACRHCGAQMIADPDIEPSSVCHPCAQDIAVLFARYIHEEVRPGADHPIAVAGPSVMPDNT